MAYVIAEPCIDHNDKACLDVCPVDCISAEPGPDRKFYIDPGNCIDCGSCEQACPNGAIYEKASLPAEWVQFAWIDKTWFSDAGRAREAIDSAYPDSMA